LSFSYGAFSNFTANIYDGLNGTGTVLASVDLSANNAFAFSPTSISFSVTGRSFPIAGVAVNSDLMMLPSALVAPSLSQPAGR
jgi:hypothetical protein